MATIRFDKNINKWQAIIRRKGIKQQSKVFKIKSQAIQWARSVECEIDKGNTVDFSLSKKITLNQIIEKIQPIDSRERSRLNILMEYFNGSTVNLINPSRIALFVDLRLSQGLSSATVVKDINTLSKLLKVAQRDWNVYLPNDPFKHIGKLKQSPSRVRRLSKNEEFILINRSQSNLRNIIIFAIETGMRLGEILSLKWSDINNNLAVLEKTKNGDIRYVPMTKKANQILMKIQKNKNDDRVFYFWKTVSGFESSWQKFKKREGLVDLRFHDLRHEAISRMFEKGMSHMEVSAISGHKSLLVLRKYTHLNIEYLRDKLAQ
jgi:integrase